MRNSPRKISVQGTPITAIGGYLRIMVKEKAFLTYQEAFTMPGIIPPLAISRKQRRDSWNFLR